MKKVLSAAFALLLLGVSAQAQSIHPRVEAALNLAKIQAKTGDGTDLSFKVRPGVRVGVAAEIDLASGVYLAPGLVFRQEGARQEGAKEEHTVLGQTVKNSVGLNYLGIPVNLGIRVGLTDAIAVSVEAGPSFAYGFSSVSSVKDAEDVFKNKTYKRFDAGLNASAAIEYSKLYLRVGTEIGMTNNLKDAVAKATSKNSSFFVGLGYRF